ncbi:DUF6916 family protein [Woodsholea maritima]|uniref:DUF6916 family protein n=1 Tax=Woodsholea maritima TaxID=240237 RepID=UPI00035C1D8F|nr:hypothetical protein [Woodsholea maritima]
METLTTLTIKTFEALGDNNFILRAQNGEDTLTLELIEVKAMGQAEREGGAFAILFQGPPQPKLDQATYGLEHSELGTVALFLVPVAEKAVGFQYEAIFT